MRLNTIYLVAVCVTSCAVSVRAEMPPQDPQKADVIVVGRVESISKTKDSETDYFFVSIRIESVERGASLAAGDLISVNTFKWARPGRGKVGASGHNGLPKVGDQVRMYAYKRHPGYAGAYPHWYDLLKSTEIKNDSAPIAEEIHTPVNNDSAPITEHWRTSVWNSNIFRTITLGIFLIGLLAAVWSWKRRRKATRLSQPGFHSS